MNCPVKHNGFARLPGQTFDDSARQLRRAFESPDILDQVLDECLKNEVVPLYTRDAQAASYATASVVIDHLWVRITNPQNISVLRELRSRHSKGSYEERVSSFVRCYLGFLMFVRNRFFEEIKERVGKEGGALKEDKIFLAFGLCMMKYKPETKGIPVPSMNDLIVLFARMAFVAPQVFERDIGRAPFQEEVFGLLRSSFTLGFFTELMANNREVTLPLIGILEQVPCGDLDNLDNRFGVQFFRIERVVGRQTLKVKEEIVQEYRSRLEDASENKDPSRTLGCPALYGGKFREIFYWVCTEFEEWVNHKE